MKRILLVLLQILGVFIAFQGIQVLLTETRGNGVAIYKIGFIIPLNDQSILLYGLSFCLFGLLLIVTPVIAKTRFIFRKSTSA
ncbi:hypothetical protein [uncultured Brevibacillus sp.]|uniref:hypothetical protein n=1 Tax=uncultured Brevibacillus sp. TaxID=169970 RepID=UPI00259A4F99|nr:hypothetical protein [uncultured Brevibacillus sp.]